MEHKTISKQIEEACEEMCDKYCKMPEKYGQEEWDKMMNEDRLPCDKCPLYRLI